MGARSKLILLAATLLTAGLPALPGSAQGSADYDVVLFPPERIPLSPSAETISLSDDVVTSLFPIGFQFSFFREPTDVFWIGSNGFITLFQLTGPGCCEGQVLPTPGDPDGIIAGFWTDLDPSAGGEVRIDRLDNGSASMLVVDYDQIPVKGTSGTATFQIVLFDNDRFEVRVFSASDGPNPATIGAENFDGSLGLTVAGPGVSLVDTGFRFIPILPDFPTPVISDVSPPEGGPGDVLDVLGSGFVPESQVLVEGVSVPKNVVSSSRIQFLVPDLPTGVKVLEVRQPDGKSDSTTFTLLSVFALDAVSPGLAFQGGSFTVLGSGFEAATEVLLDDRLVVSTLASSRELDAVVPSTLTPGLYDVSVFDEDEGVRVLADALLVKGLPDLAVEILAWGPARATTDLTPSGVGLPGSWSYEVRVANRGDAASAPSELMLVAGPADGPLSLGASSDDWSEFVRPLAPGEATVLEGSWGDASRHGEHELAVALLPSGADRDPGNHFARAANHVGVGGLGGFGGFGSTVCVFFWCTDQPVYEERTVTETTLDQLDVHKDVVLRLDATMDGSTLDFGGFDRVFGFSFTDSDGNDQSCTTWRFRGAGSFELVQEVGNGLSGGPEVVAAASSQGNGSLTETTWRETYLLNVLVEQGTPDSSNENTTGARFEYPFSEGPLALEWMMGADNLVGDLSECIVVTPQGESHVAFTFADLPADDLPIPNFDGNGAAKQVVVSFEESSREERTEFSIP